MLDPTQAAGARADHFMEVAAAELRFRRLDIDSTAVLAGVVSTASCAASRPSASAPAT